MKAENRVYEVEIANGIVTMRQKAMFGTPMVERMVRLSDITALEFSEAKFYSTGSLKVIHAGSKGGLIFRPINHDKVEFNIEDQDSFRTIRDEIRRALAGVQPS